MINEMMGLQFRCTEAEIANGACIYTTGEQVLDTFGLPHGDTGAHFSFSSRPPFRFPVQSDWPRSSAGKYCGILAALVVLWRLAAFAGLHLRVAFM